MSDLTNLQICKRIAEIECVIGLVDGDDFIWSDVPRVACQTSYDDYNPLTDDALCFRLMVKYKVDLWRSLGVTHAMIAFDKPNPNNIKRVKDEDYNKAILLAIIEANKNEAK